MLIRLFNADRKIGVYEVDRLPTPNETILVEYPSMLTTGTVPWKVISVYSSSVEGELPVVAIAEEWQTERLTARLIR